MKWKYFFTVLKLFILVALPIVLLVLPKDFFDHGPSLCLSQLLFHIECYGCGMTRACMHLIHLDFEEAFAYNMISLVVFPLLCVIWVQWFLKEFRLYKQYRRKTMAKV